MAVWQFQCNIVPKRENIIGMNYEEVISWKGFSCSYYNISFLEIKKSWSKNIIQYGDLDGNCLEFFFKDAKLEEIECRLDLRSFSNGIFEELLKYVKSINAVFWCDGKVYFPIGKDMINIIKDSEAYKFCSNPINYLNNL